MQVREIDKDFEDLCSKSINALEIRVRKYLAKNHAIENPWILDATSANMNYIQNDDAEVVLFGSYLQRFMESGLWTCERVRFWVLCDSVKNTLVNIFNIPEDVINIIPRSKLYPDPESRISFPKKNKKITLLYGGRISESKNVEAFLYSCHHLQWIHNLNIQPVLSGDFDNMSHLYSMKVDSFNYKDSIISLIDDLSWKSTPVIREGLSEEEWLNQGDENLVYINLSTFICEDFGVSLAQAMKAGLPCILSNWGGHRDAIASNILHIDCDLIIEDSGKTKLQISRSKLIASHINENINSIPFKDDCRSKIIKKAYLGINEIDALRRGFVRRFGESSSYLSRGQANKFYALERSSQFFKLLHEEFSGCSEYNPEVLIIINDLSDKIIGVEPFCNDYASKQFELGMTVKFLSIHKVLRKSNIDKIMNAKKIVLPFYTQNLKELVTFLNSNKRASSVLEVYYGDEGTALAENHEFILLKREEYIG